MPRRPRHPSASTRTDGGRPLGWAGALPCENSALGPRPPRALPLREALASRNWAIPEGGRMKAATEPQVTCPDWHSSEGKVWTRSWLLQATTPGQAVWRVWAGTAGAGVGRFGINLHRSYPRAPSPRPPSHTHPDAHTYTRARAHAPGRLQDPQGPPRPGLEALLLDAPSSRATTLSRSHEAAPHGRR